MSPFLEESKELCRSTRLDAFARSVSKFIAWVFVGRSGTCRYIVLDVLSIGKVYEIE